MKGTLWEDADFIIAQSLKAVLPDEAVRRTLAGYRPGQGRTLLVSVGKAAWQMAKAASDILPRIDGGIVVTKYGHIMGEIPGVDCYEAGHPAPDENSFRATEKALELVKGLTADDTVIFLLSGGGSALFEAPLIPGAELRDITAQLLASGADIVEMNTIRKRLSGVKGGKFALAWVPAKVLSVVLSDILGDPLDMIASGPAAPDSSSCAQAKAIAEKYALRLSPEASALLEQETPKSLTNVETHISGSVRELCAAAANACAELGKSLAYIAGGETVVHLTGKGLGGRNQELALAAAPIIAGIPGAAVFSVGSDGTDGPTDAAGGYADGDTLSALEKAGLNVFSILRDNDAYHALKASGGLIVTGPTGTNVNDVSVALLRE